MVIVHAVYSSAGEWAKAGAAALATEPLASYVISEHRWP